MPAQLVSIEATPDLVDQVYRVLLGAISSGALAPGERITQEDIAQRLSVSRQPVLQALRLLKKDGFVHDAPGRGVLVAPLDADWMRKVYQVRGALDVLAARLAAAQRFRIDPRLMERGRRAARGRNVEAMIDADMAFHQAIYEASGNPLIGQSADQHWRHLRRAMGAVLQAEPQRETLWDEHEAIAAAIAAGHAQRAAQLSEEHVARASEALGRRLAQQLARAASTTPTRKGDKA
ncbi:DNA-binding GntR family transcriptional regulator [Variovorax paradoxus]|uniref:DNA-binding GntR family transcriptional regulator n=1 Tax=Variovorax paradoxus TaxID=34073 RepID=A0AAE3Y5K8_VARPD|nr:GntR family transcriptional regulator [Variovorax paradoxus]MDP9968753.1 DNA-binding GntR family transcriptional regulator [Variovorax paradoxus]MDR6430034.1 DNA-binding GntR family transcriptional regulator [Variovorax paradoxus]